MTRIERSLSSELHSMSECAAHRRRHQQSTTLVISRSPPVSFVSCEDERFPATALRGLINHPETMYLIAQTPSPYEPGHRPPHSSKSPSPLSTRRTAHPFCRKHGYDQPLSPRCPKSVCFPTFAPCQSWPPCGPDPRVFEHRAMAPETACGAPPDFAT